MSEEIVIYESIPAIAHIREDDGKYFLELRINRKKLFSVHATKEKAVEYILRELRKLRVPMNHDHEPQASDYHRVPTVASPVRLDGDWNKTWKDWWDATGFGLGTHPNYIKRFRAYHTGIDFNHKSGLDIGRSVYASADGVVCFAGKIHGWYGGDVVVIEHALEDMIFWTRYAHVEPVVKRGQEVKAGDLIAYIADYPQLVT